MPRYDLVLFDCDGTLYDTYPGIRANLIHTLELMGKPAMPADFNWRVCVGPPLEFIFETILGVPKDEVTEACSIFRSHYDEIAIPNTVIFPGMNATLRRLVRGGVTLGVASSKSMKPLGMTMALDPCGVLFTCILGPTPENPLSKTQLILNAARITGFPAERILMVGDTYYDAEGALQAGMDFCGVSWGYDEPGYEKRLPCAKFVSDPMEIADFVLGEEPVPARIGNPLEETTRQRMYAEDGVAVRLPDEAEDLRYFRIRTDPVLDEVRFSLNGRAYVFRTAAGAASDDISGMYFPWDTETELALPGARLITVRTAKEGQGIVLENDNGVRCSLSCTEGADATELAALYSRISLLK